MPWHQTRPQTQDYQWFKNLVELHEITHSWREAIQVERPEHFMTRGIQSSATENLWMLDSLSEKNLEDFLAEKPLTEVLAKLEHAVWTVQAWTLEHFLQAPGDSTVMMSVLEQLCWKAGRASAERRWSQRLPKEGTVNTQRPPFTLSQAVLSFEDSPLSGYPHRKSTLIRRATHNQIDLELLHCPHQSKYQELTTVADALCHLHWNFFKGFAYTLDHRIRCTYTKGDPNPITHSLSQHQISARCTHTWTLQSEVPGLRSDPTHPQAREELLEIDR